MKVDGFGNIKSTSNIKKRSGVAVGGSFSDFLDISAEAGIVGGEVSMVAAAPELSGIIALQELADASIAKKRLLKHGENILDSLENLRRNILLGRVSLVSLQEISQQLSKQREEFNDPQLTEIIDEIELRAAVEIAKLEVAGKNV